MFRFLPNFLSPMSICFAAAGRQKNLAAARDFQYTLAA